MNKKGFTIVELMVVIGILAILTAIAVPVYLNKQEETKLIVDNASTVALNRATEVYAAYNRISTTDIFDSIDTDTLRMQKLVDEGFLYKIAEPASNNVEFTWSVDNQIWTYDGQSSEEEPIETEEPVEEDDLSGYAVWKSNKAYPQPNTYIQYNGKLYYNQWWTRGTTPGTNVVWQEVSDTWVFYNVYTSGDTTEYNGHTYRARFWTQGVTPVHSEYGEWEQID